MQKSIAELTDEVNSVLAADVPRAMKALGQMPGKVTTKELEEYLDFRPKLAKALNDKHKTKSTLDRIETEDSADLLNEVAEITKRLTTAVQVAGSLYGVKDQPSRMFAKIQLAELESNLQNVKRQAMELHFLSMNNEPIEVLTSLVEELSMSLDTIKELYDKYKPILNEDAKEYTEKTIKAIEQTLEMFKEHIETEKAIEKQDKDAAVTLATPEELAQTIKDAGVLADKKEETPSDDQNAKEVTLDKSINRITFKESKANGDPAIGNPQFPSIQEALAEGTIKHKAATTLTVNEEEIDPDSNPHLKKTLEDAGLLESYIAGFDAIEEDSSKIHSSKNENSDFKVGDIITPDMVVRDDLSDIDGLFTGDLIDEGNKQGKNTKIVKIHGTNERGTSVTIRIVTANGATTNTVFIKKQKNKSKTNDDVLTFLRYMPVSMNIYDKIADREDLHYNFEITPEDNIVYQQYLFTPSVTVNTKDEEMFAQELAKLDPENQKDYQRDKLALENKFLSRNRSSRSNMEYRKALLTNLLNGVNELKLKVHNVDQGNFEHFKGGTKVVEEFNVSDLGYDAKTIEMENILYGAQDSKHSAGGYIMLNGQPTLTAGTDHFAANMPKPESGKMYFGYEDKSGRIVPIKMNMAKLSPDDVNLIFKQMEKYLLATNKDAFRVEVSKKENAIIAGQKDPMNMETFLSYFLKPKRNSKGSPLFVKNVFSLITKNIPGNMIKFELHDGGV